jgi:ribosomal protein L7/L12
VPEHNCVEIVDGTLDKDERIEVLKRGREIVEVGAEEARQFLLSYAGM